MRINLFILFFVSFSSYSSDDADWQVQTRFDAQDTAYSDRVSDSSGNFVYSITQAQLNTACQNAEKKSQGYYNDIYLPSYESSFPDYQWRYTSQQCVFDGQAGERPSSFYITATVWANIEYKPKDSPSESTPEQICAAKPPEGGVFNNVQSYDGERYIYYNGCQYEATGVIVCQGDGTVCAATWKPTGVVADSSSKPSSPVGDGGDTGGGDTGGGDTGGGDTGGGNSGGGTGSGSSLTKGDIQSAIEGASPHIAKDIRDELTETDDLSADRQRADESSKQSVASVSSSVTSNMTAAGTFADPGGFDYGDPNGNSDLDKAITFSKDFLLPDSKQSVWSVFDGVKPVIPNGSGCSDLIIFPDEVYQITITCDKIKPVKEMLSWVFYALTFWYVFTSASGLFRKGE